MYFLLPHYTSPSGCLWGIANTRSPMWNSLFSISDLLLSLDSSRGKSRLLDVALNRSQKLAWSHRPFYLWHPTSTKLCRYNIFTLCFCLSVLSVGSCYLCLDYYSFCPPLSLTHITVPTSMTFLCFLVSQLFRRHQALQGRHVPADLSDLVFHHIFTCPLRASHTQSVCNSSPFAGNVLFLCLPNPYFLRNCLFHLSNIIADLLLPSPCCLLPLASRTYLFLSTSIETPIQL